MSDPAEAHDLLVRTPNPEMFDRTMMAVAPCALIQDVLDRTYLVHDDCYVLRVFGDPGYVKFAMQSQGYGEFVRELEEPL